MKEDYWAEMSYVQLTCQIKYIFDIQFEINTVEFISFVNSAAY